MTEQKRILILTADAGFGHRSAANAVADALRSRYGEHCAVKILNPLDDRRTPLLLRESGTDYDRILREAPELYRLGYETSALPVTSAIVESALVVLLFDVLQDVLRTERPDAILTTYPIYQAVLTAIFSVRRYYVPLLTVVTDLVSVHRLWFHDKVDACLVPTEAVRQLALRAGVPEGRIHITGIPVSPAIAAETRSRSELRKMLGWETNRLTFLAVGSKRVGNLPLVLDVLNHAGYSLQLVISAGRDADLYRKLCETEWHVPVHLYEYVANMPEMMRAADVLICKAGGLIVTEGLAAGLPLILVDVLPGQEEGNARYVVDHGAGLLVETPMQMLETLRHWTLDRRHELRGVAMRAQHLGRPRAAERTAQLLWAAAQRGPLDKTGKHIIGRRSLAQVLDPNHARWQDPLGLRSDEQSAAVAGKDKKGYNPP